MKLRCPNCKNALPPNGRDILTDRRITTPEPGDWIECGMCPRIWQYQPKAKKAKEAKGKSLEPTATD